jgi:hypothetical protein
MEVSQVFKQLSAALIALFTLGLLAGCAEKPVMVDNGPVRIQSALINGRLPEGWTVKAVSVDAHSEMAGYVNDALKKGGYNVVAGEAKVTYSIREVYAGPASKYKQAHTGAGTVLATGASIALTIAACATLNSCSSPGVIGNGVASNITTASNVAQNASGQSVENLDKVNLVIHSICMSRMGCASSAAASSDSSLTLDDLRKENAELGLTRSMRLGEKS